jgi:hypothetical protein
LLCDGSHGSMASSLLAAMFPMTGWQGLSQELDLWADTGRTATFWWRDDDAVAPTPQLNRLLRYAESVPLALAVIPKSATRELAQRIRDLTSVVVLQHGWAHVKHASDGLSEYPSTRRYDEVGQELAAGRRVLEELFAAQSLSVFVPPFHSFDDSFLPLLVDNGIDCISRRGPRPGRYASSGLFQVNTHVSAIQWATPPHFGDEAQYLAGIVDHLRGRRTGRYDPAEPTGLLTHHLWQDDDSYHFISTLVSLTSRHPAVKWLHGREVFYAGEAEEPWEGHSTSNPRL